MLQGTLRLNNHLLAKRIQRTFDGGITVVSDNTIYPPQIISKSDLDELEIIGRVVWMGKKV